MEADSGGHTDNRPLVCLLPVILDLRDRIERGRNVVSASVARMPFPATGSLSAAFRDLAGNAEKIVGGGDTIALLQESGFDEKQLGFLSTGGGAMLEYLLKGTLPGIEGLG